MKLPISKVSPYVLNAECNSGSRRREIFVWNAESGKFAFVESGILGFGIQNKAQGIRIPLMTEIPNPSSTDKEFGKPCLKSVIHGANPESKTVMGRKVICRKLRYRSAIAKARKFTNVWNLGGKFVLFSVIYPRI